MAKNHPAAADQVQPTSGENQSGTRNVQYRVEISDENGKVKIAATTDGPVGKFDWVGLFRTPPAQNPNGDEITSFYMQGASSLITKENWGPGFHVAYVAYDYRNEVNEYQKIVEAGPT